MSEESLEERIKPYIAPAGAPKKYTKNPCRLCGWTEIEAIHQNPQLHGKGPYHTYRGNKHE